MPNQNEYYTQQFSGTPHGLVRTEAIIASLNAIATGLNKLPGERELLEDRVTAVVATGGPTAYVVTMDSPPTAYVDGIALQVRFPMANLANPTLDLNDPDGNALGAKPIRQVDGTALTDGHIAENARAELYYVTEGSGYWTLGAGARGATGPAGPPDGAFSLSDDGELEFTPTGGSAVTLGPATFRWRGAHDNATEYEFLNLVRSGGNLYFYINATAASGNAVTDTTHWQPLLDTSLDASTTQKGVVELATNAETSTGSDATRAVTPAGLNSVLGTAAAEDTGTASGDIPVLGTGGRLAAARVDGTANQRTGTLKFWSGSESQYSAIASKDPDTVYFVTS